jgi:hypothetical protein
MVIIVPVISVVAEVTVGGAGIVLLTAWPAKDASMEVSEAVTVPAV